VTTFAYDGRGNLTGMTLPDLSTRAWTYDPTFSQETSYRDENGRTTTYTLDGRGNRLTETDPLGRVTTYSYDTRGNLTSVTRPDPDGARGSHGQALQRGGLGALGKTTATLSSTINYQEPQLCPV
jgi:YD repeat-containing protein